MKTVSFYDCKRGNIGEIDLEEVDTLRAHACHAFSYAGFNDGASGLRGLENAPLRSSNHLFLGRERLLKLSLHHDTRTGR